MIGIYYSEVLDEIVEVNYYINILNKYNICICSTEVVGLNGEIITAPFLKFSRGTGPKDLYFLGEV